MAFPVSVSIKRVKQKALKKKNNKWKNKSVIKNQFSFCCDKTMKRKLCMWNSIEKSVVNNEHNMRVCFGGKKWERWMSKTEIKHSSHSLTRIHSRGWHAVCVICLTRNESVCIKYRNVFILRKKNAATIRTDIFHVLLLGVIVFCTVTRSKHSVGIGID